MHNQATLWIVFNVFVVGMLLLDQFIFHKKSHTITLKEALGWSTFWIVLALLFNVWIYVDRGPKSALEFFTGYLIELSLSIDNLFVFIVIFSYFKVPHQYQHKVLFWGVLGAQVMRAFFILTGVSLINTFHWVIYIFGGFLVLTGIKMATHKDEDIHPEYNPLFKFFRKFLPANLGYESDNFFVRKNGWVGVTPLFMVLLVVDITDLLFALDSVPAVLAITLDSFIVYSSNIFAILGLRSFYFVLARIMQLFHYLHYGLSFILTFVGIKMLLGDIYPIPISMALGIVAMALTLSIVASIIWPKPVTLSKDGKNILK